MKPTVEIYDRRQLEERNLKQPDGVKIYSREEYEKRYGKKLSR